jgi:hypothetical protein
MSNKGRAMPHLNLLESKHRMGINKNQMDDSQNKFHINSLCPFLKICMLKPNPYDTGRWGLGK